MEAAKRLEMRQRRTPRGNWGWDAGKATRGDRGDPPPPKRAARPVEMAGLISVAKWAGAERESAGAVVPMIAVKDNAAVGKGPDFSGCVWRR